MTQDVTVESTADTADNDVEVEEVQKQEPEIKDEPKEEAETEVEADADDESSEDGEGEEEQKPKTVEERLAEIEAKYEEKVREAEAKQKKIDRQTAAYNDMQKALEKERQERQAALEKDAPKEPSIDDFDTYQDYVDALSDFKAEQKIQQKEAEFKQRQYQEKIQALAEERARIANEQEAEYLKVNPRYKASKAEFQDFISSTKVDKAVENAIVDMAYKGNVPQLIDYFGANNGEKIEELQKICRMNPVEAGVEIYKIQQKLVAPKKEESKPLPKPVKAAPASKVSKTLTPQSDVLKSLGLK